MGESEGELLTWAEVLHTVHVHEVSHLELPAAKAKRGKASLLTDTIQISVFTKNEETGEDEEVGRGWSVGKKISTRCFDNSLRCITVYQLLGLMGQ